MTFSRLLKHQISVDLHSRFMGSLLGLWWSVVNPIMQLAVYVFLFTVVLDVRLGGTTGKLDYAIFALSGLGAWFATQEALTQCASSIHRNSAIVKNFAFPAELFPLSSIVCSFVTMAVAYGMVVFLGLLAGRMPGLALIALPLVLAVHFLLMCGIGIYLAIIGAFLRDIMQILPIALQLAMLATPILYSRSDVPDSMRRFADYNPLFYLIDSYRQIFSYNAWPNFEALAVLGMAGIVLSAAGLFSFRKVQGYFEGVV